MHSQALAVVVRVFPAKLASPQIAVRVIFGIQSFDQLYPAFWQWVAHDPIERLSARPSDVLDHYAETLRHVRVIEFSFRSSANQHHFSLSNFRLKASVLPLNHLRFPRTLPWGSVWRGGDVGIALGGFPMSTREPGRWASTAGTVVLVASLFVGLFAVGAAIAGLLV
jgi:hypothetical protein